MIGFDYASVDGNRLISFSTARLSGASFVFIRRSYTLTDAHGVVHLAADPCYARDAQAVRDAGLTVGAYLFPSFHKNAPSPEDQVAFFAKAGGDILIGHDFPPTLDLELSGNGIANTGLSQPQVIALACRFITALRATYGCYPIIYSSHVEICDTNGLGMTSQSGGVAVMSRCPLWQKVPYPMPARQHWSASPGRPPHFGASTGDPADLWRVPPPWDSTGWWILQRQGDAIGAPGFDGTVDVDEFFAGSSGVQIQWLQSHLGIKADGVYGPVTLTAVQAYQKERNLTPDGLVGPATMARVFGENK